MPYRIKIYSSFCTQTHCKTIYERLCQAYWLPNYGREKDIYILDENDPDDSITHIILLNTVMPIIHPTVPKENIVGFAFEPPVFLNITSEFIQYAQKYIGKYYIGEKGNLPDPFIEGHSYMWHIPIPQNPDFYTSCIKHKQFRMSIMVSEKLDTQGHQYRHQLVKEILKHHFPIDIYGRGCKFYSSTEWRDPRIKGEFQGIEPYENYHFHISIENCQTPHYFSEKLLDPLLCRTTPIYLGCKPETIETYFPGNVIFLSGTLYEDMKLLNDILCGNLYEYKRPIILEKVWRTINLLNDVDRIF